MIALIGLLVTSFVFGMTVAVVTMLLSSEEIIKSSPGGSIMAGLLTATARQQTLELVALCAVAGLAGWFVFAHLILPRLPRKK